MIATIPDNIVSLYTFTWGHRMDQLLTNATLCHQQADRMRALALAEADKTKRRLLLAVSEHYYLLHDQLVELYRHLLTAPPDPKRTEAH